MINLSITGDTEIEIERLAQAAGLTPGQWLRVAIGAAIVEADRQRDPLADWPGTWIAASDPGVPRQGHPLWLAFEDQGKALSGS